MARMKISTAEIENLEITIKKGENGKFVCRTKVRTADMPGPPRTLSVKSDDSIVAALSGVASDLKRSA